MGVKRYEDLATFQFAVEFKTAVYDLIARSPPARHDFKFLGQINDAVSGIERCIVEGFKRGNAAENVNFLRYALGSIEEARIAVRDGIPRGHFRQADCRAAWIGDDAARMRLPRI